MSSSVDSCCTCCLGASPGFAPSGCSPTRRAATISQGYERCCMCCHERSIPSQTHQWARLAQASCVDIAGRLWSLSTSFNAASDSSPTCGELSRVNRMAPQRINPLSALRQREPLGDRGVRRPKPVVRRQMTSRDFAKARVSRFLSQHPLTFLRVCRDLDDNATGQIAITAAVRAASEHPAISSLEDCWTPARRRQGSHTPAVWGRRPTILNICRLPDEAFERQLRTENQPDDDPAYIPVKYARSGSPPQLDRLACKLICLDLRFTHDSLP